MLFVSTKSTPAKFLLLNFHILQMEWCCYLFFLVSQGEKSEDLLEIYLVLWSDVVKTLKIYEKTFISTEKKLFVPTRGTSPKFLLLNFHILQLERCCYLFFSVFGFLGGEITGSTRDMIGSEIWCCHNLKNLETNRV